MFFNESAKHNSVVVEASETGLTPDLAGGYRMIAESTEEWYNLREKMMRCEHTSIVNEDASLLNEGVKEFFGRIADFFRKIWAKIQEYWKKFTVMISRAVLGDKEFVKKYEKEIMNRTTTGFKYEGYKWQNLDNYDGPAGLYSDSDVNVITGMVSSATADSVKKLQEKWGEEDAYNAARGKCLKGSPVDAGDFAEALHKHFRGDEKEEIESVNVKNMLDTVSDANKNIKAADKNKSAADKFYQSVIKHFETVSKDLEKSYKDEPAASVNYAGDNGSTQNGKYTNEKKEDYTNGGKGYDKSSRNAMRDFANLQASIARKISTIASQAFSAHIQAIKDRRQEYRAVLARLVTYKVKSEGYDFNNESASILDRF